MYIKMNKTDKKNIFFISDPHFYHSKVIIYDNRPFWDDYGKPDVLAMNEKLIENWNSVVGKDDVVFILGDIVWGGLEKHLEILYRLNGELHSVLGNHDSYKLLLKTQRFTSINHKVNLYVKTDPSKKGGQLFVLDHFANLVWDKHHRGSIHLHGHSHGSLMSSPIEYISKHYYKRRVMDVGCNNIDYTPISYDEVMEIMENKGIQPVDHHRGKEDK